MDVFSEGESTILVPQSETQHGRDVHVEIKRDRSHDTRGHTPSNIGVTFRKPRKTLVLCFDGTGNQFHGDSSDSNILQIFRMLDRNSGKGFHYYQPGIGTYVGSDSLSSSGSIQNLKNWYIKAKDAAIGTSFDEHVVGGYKFMMQYYSPGDNIYMFGFSRGAYTARFLAEMIDWIGLITHGNEEMIQFGWRTFSKWKAIDSSCKGAKVKQKKAYEFMVSFRETFSRPVRRIRFLGLFDTVNSVPRFESALMNRQRIPFSAVSSAKIIRHAVSIDERRAKFRADLISHGIVSRKEDLQEDLPASEEVPHHDGWIHRSTRYKEPKPKAAGPGRTTAGLAPTNGDAADGRGRKASEEENHVFRYRDHSHHSNMTHSSHASATDIHLGFSLYDHESHNCRGSFAGHDATSLAPPRDWDDDVSSDGEEDDQDIEELWFPGGHADIGGGWVVNDGETPLSHVPLLWIVREAQRSGLEFDEQKMEALNCLDTSVAEGANMPMIEISSVNGDEKLEGGNQSKFKQILEEAASKGLLHDSLRFNTGSPAATVIRWRIMEWMPFRRLDLTEEGKWLPIRWPLPRGEVRDMPANALVHCSAIKRMQYNPRYRPGNLIMGGGGRGFITAPKYAGIGEWKVAGQEGDVVGERMIMIRKQKLKDKLREKSKANGRA